MHWPLTPPLYTHSNYTAHVCPTPPDKWCHLPGVVFIIEILKAYSVAKPIYHYIKSVLVCVRPANSLFPRLEEIRKNEGLCVQMKALESHTEAVFALGQPVVANKG